MARGMGRETVWGWVGGQVGGWVGAWREWRIVRGMGRGMGIIESFEIIQLLLLGQICFSHMFVTHGVLPLR